MARGRGLLPFKLEMRAGPQLTHQLPEQRAMGWCGLQGHWINSSKLKPLDVRAWRLPTGSSCFSP